MKLQLKIMTFFLLFVAGLFCFYKFMTYDRSYTWAKEYKYEIETIAEKSGYIISQTGEIEVEEIKRPTEKIIKIGIQKGLSKVNLMNYGHEFGEFFTLKSVNANGFLNYKGWCLDDHLVGLEIEYNIEEFQLISLKDNLEKQFSNYKIIWTQLPEN